MAHRIVGQPISASQKRMSRGGPGPIAWWTISWPRGNVDAIKARIKAHHDAGADPVCILPLATTGRRHDLAAVEALAP